MVCAENARLSDSYCIVNSMLAFPHANIRSIKLHNHENTLHFIAAISSVFDNYLLFLLRQLCWESGALGKQQKEKRIVAAKLNRFYFVRPCTNTRFSAVTAAHKLLDLNDVSEVLITSGDVGFIVKAKPHEHMEEKSSDTVSAYIKDNMGSNYLHADSHYACRKLNSRVNYKWTFLENWLIISIRGISNSETKQTNAGLLNGSVKDATYGA